HINSLFHRTLADPAGSCRRAPTTRATQSFDTACSEEPGSGCVGSPGATRSAPAVTTLSPGPEPKLNGTTRSRRDFSLLSGDLSLAGAVREAAAQTRDARWRHG